jgi:hypothetical protein
MKIFNLLLVSIILFSQTVFSGQNVIREKIKQDLSTCYDLDTKLKLCTRFSCVIPDNITNIHTAVVVRGFLNNRCYFQKYKFKGQKIIGKVRHCYFDKSNLTEYINNYFQYKASMSTIEMKNRFKSLSILENRLCRVE